MTLDELFAECQSLSDVDLDTILHGLIGEQAARKDRNRKQAWSKVCEAITHYTAHYGNIRVADLAGDEDISITLYHGAFTFSKYGDIEVGA